MNRSFFSCTAGIFALSLSTASTADTHNYVDGIADEQTQVSSAPGTVLYDSTKRLAVSATAIRPFEVPCTCKLEYRWTVNKRSAIPSGIGFAVYSLKGDFRDIYTFVGRLTSGGEVSKEAATPGVYAVSEGAFTGFGSNFTLQILVAE